MFRNIFVKKCGRLSKAELQNMWRPKYPAARDAVAEQPVYTATLSRPLSPGPPAKASSCRLPSC